MSTVQHYLMTVRIAFDMNMHAYVMADNPNQLNYARNMLIDEVEKIEMRSPMALIILETKLDKPTTKKLHAFLHQFNPEADAMRKKATTAHTSIWVSSIDGPEVDWLKAIH